MKVLLFLLSIVASNVLADDLYDVYPELAATDMEIEAKREAMKERDYIEREAKRAYDYAKADAAYHDTIKSPAPIVPHYNTDIVVVPSYGNNPVPAINAQSYIHNSSSRFGYKGQ